MHLKRSTKPSRAHRNNFYVVTQPFSVRHVYNKWNQLIGTLAFVAGEGDMVHVGVTHVNPNTAPTRKLGYAIALGRARLEYAICNGYSQRTSRASRDSALMVTRSRWEVADIFDVEPDSLPITIHDEQVRTQIRFLEEQNARLRAEKLVLQQTLDMKEDREAVVEWIGEAEKLPPIEEANPWDDPTVEVKIPKTWIDNSIRTETSEGIPIVTGTLEKDAVILPFNKHQS